VEVITMLWLPKSHPSAETQTVALLPLRDTVLLPGITLPVVAGRPLSVASAEAAVDNPDKQLVIVALRPDALERLTQDPDAEVRGLEDIYPVGTLARIKRMMRLPIGPIQLIVEGEMRVHLDHMQVTDTGFEVDFHPLPALKLEDAIARGADAATLKAMMEAIKSLWEEAASMSPDFPDELLAVLRGNDDPAELAYQSVILMQQEVSAAQAVLEENDLERLLKGVLTDLQKHVGAQRLRTQILGETKKQIDDQQREFFLRQQLKKIQEELGEGDPDHQEIVELRARMAEVGLPEAVEKQAKRELARLERVGSSSAEGGVIRTYLDWLLEMPWSKTSEDNLDLQNARAVLDADHYGLDNVKDRIVEHLATFKLKRQAQRQARTTDNTSESAQVQAERYSVGTVVCFVGPPGVGKTSLGRSIARALGRPFERISLGGLRDEAELRGHRRTYIGAMPGRIIQAMHRAGVKNPVIMLDELDKVGMDYRGDPASVLLEILDPQQNYCFHARLGRLMIQVRAVVGK
jgi:ATP-dependent Lon protease